jgi:hypothetical protein
MNGIELGNTALEMMWPLPVNVVAGVGQMATIYTVRTPDQSVTVIDLSGFDLGNPPSHLPY